MVRRSASVILICLLGAGCSVRSGLPLGPQSYAVIPYETEQIPQSVYRIGPLDSIGVSVFREPQLSLNSIQVDAGGEVVLPLIGKVEAAGKSPSELSEELQVAYGQYLKHPQVSVTVASVSQTVAVEGAVREPGVYPIYGQSSLIEALALAKSPNEVAANDQVLVFRKIGGQRMAARFDIRRIRMGLDPDPVILPGDRIVVGFEALKEVWRDYFSRPIFNIFRVL